MAAISVLSLGVALVLSQHSLNLNLRFNKQRPVKVFIALNTVWNLVNFRRGLIQAMLEAGCVVITVAPLDDYVDQLVRLGCRYEPLPMDNRGTHPGKDFLLFWRIRKLLQREKPDVYLGFTIKPNIYGSLAAHTLGVPVINNVAGLGAVFIKNSWVTRVAKTLYRIALAKSQRVFFQNDDDRKLFIEQSLVKPEVAGLLPGSGIDLCRYPFEALVLGRNRIRFLLIARMLWDKGVGEYVEAARQLKARGLAVDCCLLGFVDVQNPAAISRQQMHAWVEEGVISYLGETDDVRSFIKDADCVVLPSYREGTPRSLLEAAAMGRTIITTDAPGCRDVVDHGVNGYLCQVKDAKDLAQKMAALCALSHDQRSEMGRQGRLKVEKTFDERIVIRRYLEEINRVLEAI